MQTLEIHRSIGAAPIPVGDATLGILRSLAAGTPPYDRLALEVDARRLHVPLDARIRVAVRTAAEVRPQRAECNVTIESLNSAKFFPRFHGTIGVTPTGNSSCELWLRGRYELPAGAIGAGLDATAFHGAAEESLNGFLTWLADESLKITKATEAERIRRVRSCSV